MIGMPLIREVSGATTVKGGGSVGKSDREEYWVVEKKENLENIYKNVFVNCE